MSVEGNNDTPTANAISEGVRGNAGSSQNVLEIDATVPHWSVSKYCVRYANSLDVRRFKALWSGERNDAIYDRFGTRRDSDIGAWKRRWASLGNWCAGVMHQIGAYDMPFVRHADEVMYVRNLRSLWLRAEELPGVDYVKGCYIPRPFDQFYLVKDVAEWWRELDLERRQRVNLRGPRFIEGHNLEIFALPLRERNSFYVRRPQVWEQYETPRALGVPTPVVYSYLSGDTQSGTSKQQRLCCVIGQMEYVILALGAILRTVRYGVVARLASDAQVEVCRGLGALLRMPEALVEQWFKFRILRCIRDMAVDPVMALLAVARVTGINRAAQPEQEWFPFNYKESSIVRIPAVAPVHRQQVNVTMVEEGGHAKICPIYYVDRGMTCEFASAAWRRFQVHGVDLFIYPLPEQQYLLIGKGPRASGSADAENEADGDASVVHVSPVRDDEDEDWDLADAVGLDQVGAPVGVMHRLHDLQDACRAKRQKVPQSVYEAVALAEEVLKAPNEAGPSERVEEGSTDSVRQLKLKKEAAQAEVQKLKEKLAPVTRQDKDAVAQRDGAAKEREQRHWAGVEKLTEEAPKRESDLVAARDKAEASCVTMKGERDQTAEMYHGVLVSIRQLAQRGESKKDKSATFVEKVRKWYDDSRKANKERPASSVSGTDTRIVDFEDQLEAKVVELSGFQGLAEEAAGLPQKSAEMWNEITHLREEAKAVSTFVEELTVLKDKKFKVLKDKRAVKDRNVEVDAELSRRDASIAAVEKRVDTLTEELEDAKQAVSKLRVEIANLRTSGSDVVTGLQQMDARVGNALIAVTKSVKDVQKSVSGKMCEEWEETWKRMSTHLNMEFSGGVAIMHAAFKQDSEKIHRKVAHCKAVVESQLQNAAQSSSASGDGTSAPSGEEIGTEGVNASSSGPTVRGTEPKGVKKA